MFPAELSSGQVRGGRKQMQRSPTFGGDIVPIFLELKQA
jgi:hypothetical protein